MSTKAFALTDFSRIWARMIVDCLLGLLQVKREFLELFLVVS